MGISHYSGNDSIKTSTDNPLPVSVVGAVSITQNSITSTISYIATSAGTGYSIDDHITATLFWDISTPANPEFLIAAWYNWDTAAEIAAPNMAHLTAVAEDALTDTQLRASPVTVNVNTGPDVKEVNLLNHANYSGTITSGGSSQTLCTSVATGRYFFIQNNSSADLWFNVGTAAVQSQPSVKIPPGGFYETPAHMLYVGTIYIIGGTTGQAFTCISWGE